MSVLSTVLDVLLGLLAPSKKKPRGGSNESSSSKSPRRPRATHTATPSPGETGWEGAKDDITREVDPHSVQGLHLQYAPNRDGEPDAGEIVWTWVPYEENDGRGKDRPVLVIARAGASSAYAVRLTSKAHDGERDFISIGTGDWDNQGRESWLDLDQLYLIKDDGMRREAAALDRTRYDRVAEELHRRYGW